MINKELFKEVGFTDAETKIYLALLETGPTSAGLIMRKTELQNSVLHRNLQRLIEKGFISYVEKGKRRIYQAVDPKQIIKDIDEKKNNFEKMLPQLESLKKPFEKQEAKIFVGFKGFKNALSEFIEEAKNGGEYLIFSLGVKDLEKYENITSYYRDFEKVRKSKGIISKAIAPKSQKPFLKESSKIINIKFVDFPTPLDISIFNDKLLMSSWGEKETFFIIESRALAESFRKYFYSIWNQ
jgi:HTH-type transcriptional regulator, sugar sensing transcriptional regulator